MSASYSRYETATRALCVWAIQDESGTIVGRVVARQTETASGHCVRAWVKIDGEPIAEGAATGGGYNLQSAAIGEAFRAMWPAMPVPMRAHLSGLLSHLESGSLEAYRGSDGVASFRFVQLI